MNLLYSPISVAEKRGNFIMCSVFERIRNPLVGAKKPSHADNLLEEFGTKIDCVWC